MTDVRGASVARLRVADVTLAEFRAAVEAPWVEPASAAEVVEGVPVYDGALVAARADIETEAGTALAVEWAEVLLSGAGAFAVSGAADRAVVDEATSLFEAILTDEAAGGGDRGDHFAEAGANQRIWNSLEKHCRRDPGSFVRYYGAPALHLAAQAWLGPGYQVTAQLNLVNPGASAQEPHRDYHLGFMTDAAAERYLSHVHRLTPALTLQAAIVHTDMPLETGPTYLVPGSQRYEAGYLAWRHAQVRDYVAERRRQVPLEAGDLLVFNPAVLHGAGANRTTTSRRMANLLQISSAFGRAMEDVDRRAMVAAVYPEVQRRWVDVEHRPALRRALAACAEGYPFPGDLDRDQPTDGLAPASDVAIVEQALDEGWPAEKLTEVLPVRSLRGQG
ncbi:MAG: phytanoyl-CoA dioxygenase family protein [Actinomycetota bacterium]